MSGPSGCQSKQCQNGSGPVFQPQLVRQGCVTLRPTCWEGC
jgi:hypothetical protein